MKTYHIILGFALVKLLIHVFFNTQYGLHRDEYLYFIEGQHLGWGYMEGPPMIGLLAAIANLFGSSAFALRLLPAIAGVLSIILIGKLVLELGGKRWAVFFACLAFLLSPTYLRSNMLFQPVSFNQFFWLLTIYVVILIIKRKDTRLWYVLGCTLGLGLLTKYSLFFLLIPLFVASLMDPEVRKWYRTKHPYLAMMLTIIIVLPNVYWQYTHNFPVLVHMENLRASQLVNVHPLSFLRDQVLNHLSNSIVWISGLGLLLFSKDFRPYRILAIAYVGMILLLIVLSGKSYYSMGIYTSLFAFGGIALERLISKNFYRTALAAFLVVSLIPFIPFAIPVLPIHQLEDYCRFMDEAIGLDAPITWEDGRKYPIPQDYADMRGWEDMVMRVADLYHSLPKAEQEDVCIWGGGYGHAGAINFYRGKYNLPEAVSLSASFVIWCPDENDFSTQIVVDDVWQTGSEFFADFQFIDSSEVYLSRDPGYIYLKKNPKVVISEVWKTQIGEAKKEFNF